MCNAGIASIPMLLSSKLFCIIIFLSVSFFASAQKWEKIYSDTNLYAVHTVTVAGKKYISFFKEESFYLLNTKCDTVLKRSDYYFDAEFKDFNNDGNTDIMLI